MRRIWQDEDLRKNVRLLLFFLTLALPFATRAHEYILSANSAYIPNDPLFRYDPSNPNFPAQWYLLNEAPSTMTFSLGDAGNDRFFSPSNIGIDSNIVGAWQRGFLGEGTTIGILGITGIEGDHPDLIDNYKPQLSRNFSADPVIASTPQGPIEHSDNHDTAVAGIAAARGNNGIGITGAAPNASLAGLRVDNADNSVNPISDENYVEAYYWQSGVAPNGEITSYPEIQIKNQSIARVGPYVRESPEVIAALNRTALNNTIHVFAAGNFRGTSFGNTNTQHRNSLNSVIAVAAVGSNGIYADYSNYGSSILVAAPGAQTDESGFLIRTTDRTLVDGFNPGSISSFSDYLADDNYTSIFNGTSATAPLVSGALALARQTTPWLNVRTAKHALVESSNSLIDTNDSAWQINGAGIRFNPNYGFGLLDIDQFVTEVESIAFVSSESTYRTTTSTPQNGNVSFVVTNAMLQEQNIKLQRLETVDITLTFSSTNPAALRGVLVSPSGTQSQFIYTPSDGLTSPAVTNFTWTYLANNFWQESILGEWQIQFSQLDGGAFDWESASITFNMGEAFVESENLIVESDISTDSITLHDSKSKLVIPKNTVLNIRDGVLLNAGQLVVDGELRDLTSAGLHRSVLINRKAWLFGNGVIKTSDGVINETGMINPGGANSIGTLSIVNDFTQLAEARLIIEIDEERSDLITVMQGGIALDGILQIEKIGDGELAEGDRFVFLSSNSGEGIYGQFDNIILPSLGAPLYFELERSDDTLSVAVKNFKRQGGTISPFYLLLLLFYLSVYKTFSRDWQ